jgi:hypothetical protein
MQRCSRLVVVTLAVSAPAHAGAIDGTWQTPCLPSEQHQGRRIRYEFAGDALEVVVDWADDAGCSVPLVSRWLRTHYVLPGGRDLHVAGPIDLRVDSVVLVARNQEVADAWNSFGLCDHFDWQVDVPHEVTGVAIEGNCEVPAAGTTIRDLIQLSGIHLFTGRPDQIEGKTVALATRPTGVDTTIPFTRIADRATAPTCTTEGGGDSAPALSRRPRR